MLEYIAQTILMCLTDILEEVYGKIILGIYSPTAPFHYAVGKYGVDNFKTVKEAKDKLGLKLCSICQVIKLERQCNEFRWTQIDDPTPTI